MPDAGQFRTPWVEVLSGLGEKGPACIRVWTGQEHWLLDVGAGPEASSPFDPAWLEGADRVLITHDHIDHIGGAGFAIIAGLPIHCTATTARALPPGADLHPLPDRGVTRIASGVRTGDSKVGATPMPVGLTAADGALARLVPCAFTA